MKKAIATAAATAVIGAMFLAGPIFAAESPKAMLGQAVKSCNQTAKNDTKAVQKDFKDKKITKKERDTKMREINKTRLSCIREAQKNFKKSK